MPEVVSVVSLEEDSPVESITGTDEAARAYWLKQRLIAFDVYFDDFNTQVQPKNLYTIVDL